MSSVAEKIHAHVAANRVSGCWNWIGTRSDGYPVIAIDGEKHPAHRVSYEEFVGAIPDGQIVDHLCENKRCVNPDHLEPAYQRVNILRAHRGRRMQTRLPEATERQLRRAQRLDSNGLNDQIATLRAAGWTGRVIADALGCSRQAVQQRAAVGVVMPGTSTPDPSYEVAVSPKPQAPKRAIKPDVAEHLVALYSEGRRLRGKARADHPARIAADKFAALAYELTKQHITVQQIADLLGCTAQNVDKYLRRRGYRSLPPSQKPYAGAPDPNGGHASHCKRGHEFAGSNVRYINGDPKRPICRSCERIRVARYRGKLTLVQGVSA